MSKDTVRVDFDHQSIEFGANPWAVYRDIRPGRPIAWSESYGGFWLLPGFHEVEKAAIDYKTFSSAQQDGLIPSQDSGGGRLLPVHSDPPHATDYRRLINPLFTVGAVAALEPTIRASVTAAIDRVCRSGSCDFISDLAEPVSGAATMAVVGWPVEDWPAIVLPVRDLSSHPRNHQVAQAAGVKVAAVRGRILADISSRRREPSDDLVSTLLLGTVQGRAITDEEIAAIVMMVLFGGVDATVAAIGNFLIYLDRDRAARDALLADRNLIPIAVDELLRYESPVQGFARTVSAPCVVGEEALVAGDRVMLLWASANRDESVFPDPDVVRFDRAPNHHLAFGAGVHRCIGATLARTELRIVLEEVLSRLRDYRVRTGEVVRGVSAGTNYGRTRVPATFTPT
jgi:cytochrome P450